MGDIWLPGYPPLHTNWKACVDALAGLMPTRTSAIILAAIAGPESGYDMHVINDTPSTGDYSVGLWQINYLGSLYAERSAAYGTPLEMVRDGLHRQARAAAGVYASQGFMAWSTTYTSGAWRQYVGGGGPLGSPGGGTLPSPPVNGGPDDWSNTIGHTANRLQKVAIALHDYTDAIRAIG